MQSQPLPSPGPTCGQNGSVTLALSKVPDYHPLDKVTNVYVSLTVPAPTCRQTCCNTRTVFGPRNDLPLGDLAQLKHPRLPWVRHNHVLGDQAPVDWDGAQGHRGEDHWQHLLIVVVISWMLVDRYRCFLRPSGWLLSLLGTF